MKTLETLRFGKITVEDNKVITFPHGLPGFEGMKKFTLIYDKDKTPTTILYLQSLEDGELALPVVNPFLVIGRYNPEIKKEWVKGTSIEAAPFVMILVTVSAKETIDKTTVNLNAPILIDPRTGEAVQALVEGNEYETRHCIAEYLKQLQGDK